MRTHDLVQSHVFGDCEGRVFLHLCQGSEYAFKQIIFLSGIEFPPLQVNVNLTEF